MALQKFSELENFLYIMENDTHFDSSQLQLIQQFRTMIESNESIVSNDIDIHAKGLRQFEADTGFYKRMLLDVRNELSHTQAHLFDILCCYMSQDNIIVVSSRDITELLNVHRRQYFNLLSDLEQMGYICRVPNKDLLINKNDGTAIMINPLFATKSHDTTQIRLYFIEHASEIAITRLKQRLNNIKVEVDQVNVGSATMKNHKLRYNKLGSIMKKDSSSQLVSDTDESSINSNNIISNSSSVVNVGV